MGGHCCKAIYEKAIRSRFRHVSDATLARPSSPLISIVHDASDLAAGLFPFRAPPSFRRAPLGFDPNQSVSPSLIGARYTRALSLRGRAASSSVRDIARCSAHERSQDGGGPFSLATHILCKRRNRVERISGSKPPGFARQGLPPPARRGRRAPDERSRSMTPVGRPRLGCVADRR